MIRRVRFLARPKEAGRPCEDFLLRCRRQSRFAISDGASISYDSRGWARTLCRHFMRDIGVGADWLSLARSSFADRSAPPAEDWAALLASDRGSYATFLGFNMADTSLAVYGIGDTILFIVGPDERLEIWPDVSHADFSREPVLLCSKPGRGAFPDTDEAFEETRKLITREPEEWAGTRLIALTDALAEWVIRADSDAERITRLDAIARHRDRASFDAWVAEAIADDDLQRDDCTVLIVEP